MKTTHFLLAMITAVTLPIRGHGQAPTIDQTEKTLSDPASIVDEIVKTTLQRGEGKTPEGVRFYTWMPPSEADNVRIRALGRLAVDPLAKYLDSRRPFEQLLAVRLLGLVGGAEAVEPLKRGLEAGRASVVRAQSLSSLANTPDDLALPIIQDMTKDADPLVRNRAVDLLQWRYGRAVERTDKAH